MRKINYLISFGLLLILAACNTSDNGYKVVKVQQVEQVQSYTYLLVTEKRDEYWIAVSSLEAEPGEKFRYTGGLEMVNFYSKDLDRTFDKVIFVDVMLGMSEKIEEEGLTPGSVAVSKKSDVKVEKVEGAITIATLFENPSDFENKRITVSGEVTKFNPAIMNKNWIHLQDGTEFDGKFDLTITSMETFTQGDKVIIEGTVTLNRDFGYGYSYDILLEDAVVVK
ncbi:GW dipeptide domain-containing protein [Bacteroidota bacterium]